MTKRQEIEEIARTLARDKGLINLTRKNLCKAAGIPTGSWGSTMGYTFAFLVRELEEDFGNQGDFVPRNRKRLSGTARKHYLVSIAVKMVDARGYVYLTRKNLAKVARVSPGTISHHFGDIDGVKRRVFDHGIDRNDYRVIAQALVLRCPVALRLPKLYRDRAKGTI